MSNKIWSDLDPGTFGNSKTAIHLVNELNAAKDVRQMNKVGSILIPYNKYLKQINVIADNRGNQFLKKLVTEHYIGKLEKLECFTKPIIKSFVKNMMVAALRKSNGIDKLR